MILKKIDYKVALGLKKFVLVTRCHILNIIELFWRFAPEDFKLCMGLAKNLMNEIKRSVTFAY
jgi:hypothetical protein